MFLIRERKGNRQGVGHLETGRQERCSHKPRMAGSPQKLEDRPGADSPSEPPEGSSSAHTLIPEFWSPELGEKFLLF